MLSGTGKCKPSGHVGDSGTNQNNDRLSNRHEVRALCNTSYISPQDLYVLVIEACICLCRLKLELGPNLPRQLQPAFGAVSPLSTQYFSTTDQRCSRLGSRASRSTKGFGSWRAADLGRCHSDFTRTVRMTQRYTSLRYANVHFTIPHVLSSILPQRRPLGGIGAAGHAFLTHI
jgi:hypothetical protein